MSTSRLGQAKDLEKYWSEHLGDQPETNVTIQSINREQVTAFPEVDRYPFNGQLQLTGTFAFEISGRNGDSFTQTGEYQYRAASGLFLLETPSDLVDSDEVFSELNTQLSSTTRIEEALSLPRDSFWRFIEAADSVETLRLRGPETTYDASKLIHLLHHDDPVETLHSDPEFSDLRGIENIETALESVDSPSEIEGVQDLDIDIYNTLIDEVEATYWFNGWTANFWYRRGELKLDAETEDSREYVIQLFERDVLSS
ncbi:hypothetical protein SAMN05444422_101463 [Halobiforma haloterrestris]|uniref:Uncharacterized protein n=1 Tax=Natronobacterium haloterrestre TaxID=148448 RepID=A0A1I1DAP0_NATHA|nr:hypothetical protein [Halobiforma haloterrestris]SFB72069.1 hypothetical protein SAMN05444422_101463 [Halobiforma haloterrestris]